MAYPQFIAHLSDIHIGHSHARLQAAFLLRNQLRQHKIDRIVVTGDITEHGRTDEYATFQDVFAEFISDGRLIAVPGNHDRLGDNIAQHMLQGKRVQKIEYPGLCVIAVDTTGSHNRFSFLGHGALNTEVIDEIESVAASVAPENFVIVALHHHPLQQPEEMFIEKVATFFKTPIAKELQLGKELIQKLGGRCDLILHGHRHFSLETHIATVARALHVYNAGSSTELFKFRLFPLVGGKLSSDPVWISCK